MSAVFTRSVVAHAEDIEVMSSGKLAACGGYHVHVSLLKISSVEIVHVSASCESLISYCYYSQKGSILCVFVILQQAPRSHRAPYSLPAHAAT